jgi:hypothetical protein
MMAVYGVESKLSPEQVIERAVAYFGERGLELETSEQDPCCVTFTGGGGHVTVTASSEEKVTDVRLETREWDYHVKQFMREIG